VLIRPGNFQNGLALSAGCASRAIEQFAELRLLIANDKSAANARERLCSSVKPCSAGDDIREKRLVRHDVIGLSQQFCNRVNDDLIFLCCFAFLAMVRAGKEFDRISGFLDLIRSCAIAPR
jgi:hypothetical protein